MKDPANGDWRPTVSKGACELLREGLQPVGHP